MAGQQTHQAGCPRGEGAVCEVGEVARVELLLAGSMKSAASAGCLPCGERCEAVACTDTLQASPHQNSLRSY